MQVEIRKHAPDPRHEHWLAQPELPLNPEQRAAYEAIRAGFDSFHAFLLAGVTGSGKTEVYLQLIRETLQAGKQALVLIRRSTWARRPWRVSSNASMPVSPWCTRQSMTVNAWSLGWRRGTARPTLLSARVQHCSRR